jgi:hypothetical protein
MNLQEAIGGRITLDFCRAYMGDQVVSWVTDDNEVAYMTVRGSDLVPMNVTVLASKEWRQQDVDRVQATAQLLMSIEKAGLPPAVIPVLLRDAGVSAAVSSAVSDAMQQQASAPAKPDAATVTAQAAMITAVAKAGLPPQALAPMLSDAGVDPQIVQALMQILSGQQATPANGPPGGGSPQLSVVQGGSPQ